MSQPYTVIINLPDTVLGDQWVGIFPITVTVNNIVQGALQRISMWFTGPNSPEAEYKLDTDGTGNAPIIISSAAAPWSAYISPVKPFLPRVGDWKWDMKFYHTGNVSPITLYSGVLTVVPTTDP